MTESVEQARKRIALALIEKMESEAIFPNGLVIRERAAPIIEDALLDYAEAVLDARGE